MKRIIVTLALVGATLFSFAQVSIGIKMISYVNIKTILKLYLRILVIDLKIT